MNTASEPLIQRKPSDPIAFIHKPLLCVGELSGIVSVEQFSMHVQSLAAQLPHGQHIINLCGNRYLFMVSICAAILREQINLLPPNKNQGTQQTLASRYDDVYVVHDGTVVTDGLTSLDISSLDLSDLYEDKTYAMDIPLQQLALISFTSGSTGESKPNLKTWETLTVSTQINRRFMFPDEQTYHLLATVPGQHMWGLETSVLMALFSPLCVADTKPLFPKDIELQLRELPEPRAIVSAPVHLRAMMEESIDYPSVAAILCATSPLSAELAETVEQRLSGTLREVYGCSEVGSMSVRRTAATDVWRRFDGIEMKQGEQGSVNASASHLSETVTLQDKLDFVSDNQFRLVGRESDMVDIAGKRGSLAEINRLLSGFTGISDGVVIFPEQDRPVPRLVAIIVLKADANVESLRDYFKAHLDAAFMPRPILCVDELPREESGKLSAKRINQLYQQLITKT